MIRGESALRLNHLQLAWLQELGVEAALLRRHAAPAVSSASATPATSAALANPMAVPPVVRSVPTHASHRPVLQDPSNALKAARAAVVRKPVAPREQVPAPDPQAKPPQRAVSLACQRYAPDAAVSGQVSVWMVVGEVPAAAGAARAQEPQRAAQLLHAMLAAVRLQPVEPVARLQAHAGLPPTDDEARPTLQAQIQHHLQTWQPACILALGRVAAGALLQTTDELESLRGKVWSCLDAAGKPVPVVVTYPPGWLLANPRHKAGVWRDLLLARAALSAP